jgi:hypothetical protein
MHKDHTLAEAIRRTAYFLWQQDGRPEGRAIEYWLRAKEAHKREIAYDQWLAEGAQPGRAESNWLEAEAAIEQPDE